MATTITRNLESSHPVSLAALEAIASIAGVSVSCSSIALEANRAHDLLPVIQMSVSSHNPFNAARTSTTVHGMLDVARALAKCVPESGLWGVSTAHSETQIETMINSAISSLIVPAYVADEAQGKLFV